MSRCICNRSIKALAAAQQVYNRTRGRPSGDDRVSSFNAGNVKLDIRAKAFDETPEGNPRLRVEACGRLV